MLFFHPGRAENFSFVILKRASKSVSDRDSSLDAGSTLMSVGVGVVASDGMDVDLIPIFHGLCHKCTYMATCTNMKQFYPSG